MQTQEASTLRGFLWVLAAFGLVTGIYGSLPFLAKNVPWQFEERLFKGIQLFRPSEVCERDADTNVSFQSVLRRIYPIYTKDREFPIEAEVVRGKQVNAFAFPGGKIFIYDGLLQQADSPEELAAVLAHEIEHIRRRHVTQGMILGGFVFAVRNLSPLAGTSGAIPKLLEVAARLKFSRNQEEEADQGALERLRDGHVNVSGFNRFFSKRLGSSGLGTLFSDHPSDRSRVEMARDFLRFPSAPILGDQEWASLKRICLPQKEIVGRQHILPNI